MYEKGGQSHKGYDVAHIYPLNPRPEEVRLLASEPRLSSDVNDPKNLIPLCKPCHTKFDKPRTVQEYRELFAIKRTLLAADAEREMWHRYPLERELMNVVDKLAHQSPTGIGSQLSLDPKSVDDKTDDTLPLITKNKVHRDVQDYYPYIASLFKDMDAKAPGAPDLIAQQIRTFYLAQRLIDRNQERRYQAVADWIQAKVPRCSRQAADVMTSFFVQHCEVFE